MLSPQLLAVSEELLKLRRAYEGATPRQRFAVALDRINNPADYPNVLVTRVSAVEAFARSLLANHGAGSRADVLAEHQRHSRKEATGLVEAYVKLHATTPKQVFGEELWEIFRLAVSARNLLVHECTYMDPQMYLPMEHACTEVLFRLADLSKTARPKRAA
jgi:hypothetical protein